MPVESVAAYVERWNAATDTERNEEVAKIRSEHYRPYCPHCEGTGFIEGLERACPDCNPEGSWRAVAYNPMPNYTGDWSAAGPLLEELGNVWELIHTGAGDWVCKELMRLSFDMEPGQFQPTPQRAICLAYCIQRKLERGELTP